MQAQPPLGVCVWCVRACVYRGSLSLSDPQYVCVCALNSSSPQLLRVQGRSLRQRPLARIVALGQCDDTSNLVLRGGGLVSARLPSLVKLDQLRARTHCHIPVSHIPVSHIPAPVDFVPLLPALHERWRHNCLPTAPNKRCVGDTLLCAGGKKEVAAIVVPKPVFALAHAHSDFAFMLYQSRNKWRTPLGMP
jgi:hypothetical protein